jgi:CRISPR type IV-associated protein Csf3
MKPIHITLEILSDILPSKYPIHLDALLYAALKDNSHMDDEEVLEILDKILDKKDGVYKASSMRYLKTNSQPITTKEWSLATRTHWSEWVYSKKTKARNVITKTGKYRKRITTRNGISVYAVDFYAVGEPEKIKYLLNCLGWIGLNNSQGFGEIGKIEIQEIADDFSFTDESGELARCLPINMVPSDIQDTVMRVENSFKPPYQSSERVLTCIPNFRIKHHF